MLWRKISWFWKAGMTERNKILSMFTMISIVLMMAGCSDQLPEVSENRETVVDHEVYPNSFMSRLWYFLMVRKRASN